MTEEEKLDEALSMWQGCHGHFKHAFQNRSNEGAQPEEDDQSDDEFRGYISIIENKMTGSDREVTLYHLGEEFMSSTEGWLATSASMRGAVAAANNSQRKVLLELKVAANVKRISLVGRNVDSAYDEEECILQGSLQLTARGEGVDFEYETPSSRVPVKATKFIVDCQPSP